MDDVVERRLTSAGIDVKGALERFMGNEALLVRFLKKFPEDPGCRNLTGAIARTDMEGAIARSAHVEGTVRQFVSRHLVESVRQTAGTAENRRPEGRSRYDARGGSRLCAGD